MAKALVCDLFKGIRGTVVDDKKVNTNGKHILSIRKADAASILKQGTERDLVACPYTAAELAQQNAFKAAAALAHTVYIDPVLKASWQSRYRTERAAGTTTCIYFYPYLMQQALKNHIDEDGNYVE